MSRVFTYNYSHKRIASYKHFYCRSKLWCGMIKIKKNEEVGRYVVASRELKAGEVILEDVPFALGPKSDSPPLCLGCFAPVDCETLCPKCQWPICSLECKFLCVHSENECEVFASAKTKFQEVEDSTDICLQYECITPLRVLLAKEKNPTRWKEEVEVMQTHTEVRKTKPIWHFNQVNIVDYLRGPCKLDRFSEDLIHSVCGILDVNSFEARASSGYLIRCLYPKIAVLSHDCISNIHHTIDSENFKIVVRAAIDIPEDGQIYCNYTYSLWPTLVRREFLIESKYFECKCQRCQDTTELGTHLGTLKCSKCDNGVILSTEPLSLTCEWKCTHCEFKTNALAVKKVYDIVQAAIDSGEMVTGGEGIEYRESIFRKYRSVFHPKNAYMTLLRAALIQMYGRVEGYTIHELPDVLQERKVELCNQLLEVLDVVEPGMTRIRGITLYELHAPLINLARSEYNSEVIDKEQFRRKMENAVEILRQSVEILKLELPNSPEAQLGIVAQESYKALKKNFEVLIETA